jgi:ABC-type nitrate/sulfonate/bicarbonate transport system permease component
MSKTPHLWRPRPDARTANAKEPHMIGAYRLKVQALRLAALAAVIAAWYYAIGPGGVSPLILPEPLSVLDKTVEFLATGELYRALAVTMGEIFVSIVIAGSLGFVIGFWGARNERRAGVVEPLLVWGYLVPHILFYPLLILWFGIGVSSKVAYAASSAIFPIAFNCLRGFRRIDDRYVRVGRAFGASPAQLDWLVKLRAGLPMAAAGLRLGAALSMITVIVAEMLASTQGLGYLLRFYSQSFSTAPAFAITVVILMVVGLFQFLINRLLPADRQARR